MGQLVKNNVQTKKMIKTFQNPKILNKIENKDK